MDSKEFVAKMEARLEPCPWCGAEARFMYAPESWVQCSKCGARMGMRSNEENAVDDWNRVVEAIGRKSTSEKEASE